MRLTQKAIERTQGLWAYDAALRESGRAVLAGIDEAGRGPLAGPVVAACVILSADAPLPGVDDSKKVPEKRREALFEIIQAQAVAIGVGIVDAQTIDRINILQAARQAFEQAARLQPLPDLYLLDAMPGLTLPAPSRSIVHGDAISYSIAAASIVAKVTRDRMMLEAHASYPQYGFDRHKGYGTRMHREALLKYGPCPLHRRSFLRKILGESP